MKHFKILFLTVLLAVSGAFFAKAGVASASGCTTGTIDSNQQGMTIVGNCPTNVRLIGVPADNNVFYSDCIQQWTLGTDFTWQWNPLPVCGGWHGGANQTFWFFIPQGQSYDCHDLNSCIASATDGAWLLHRVSGVWSFMPTGPTITITGPANASTQTDKNTQLTGGWDDIDPNLYEDIRLYWHHTGSGITSTSTGKILSATASSGTFSVPLSDFDFDYNGDWVLTAVADYKALQLSDFLQTSDLTSPTGYHLNINFSTLTTPFTFTDWPTWYTNNASGGYSAPSDFGNSFIDFFKPIFENAFGFANQVLKYFDATQAEARGQELGSVFPVADAYLHKIDLFFGGFPLSAFFLFVVIVMMAIFVIRTIFKFIPFFG